MSENIQSSFQRVEKKYLISREQYTAIEAEIKKYMKADRYTHYTICNIYYDTEDYRLIRASIDKPVYKEKLRIRSYGTPCDSDAVFVEIKKKYDGIVYKRRVVMSASAADSYINMGKSPESSEQINDEIDWFMKYYRPVPKVFIAYERDAYAGIDCPELRITFDTALRYREDELDLRSSDKGIPLLDEDKVLMEIKIPGAAPLWLARLLSELSVYPASFSKYGTYYKRKAASSAAIKIMEDSISA